MSQTGAPTLVLVDPVEANHEWYAVAGLLKRHGVVARPIAPAALADGGAGPAADVVVLAGKTDRGLGWVEQVLGAVGGRARCLVAGREASYQAEAIQRLAAGRATVVVGDPHRVVLDAFQGVWPAEARVTAPAWDPDDYEPAYPGERWTGRTAYLRLGAGCERTCGYCPFGHCFERLYGPGRRRCREPARIVDEARGWVERGHRAFRLVADQVLGEDGRANGAFEETCAGIGRLCEDASVAFTATPRDLLAHRDVLERCGRRVRLRPAVAFDFVTDDMMARFRLPSRQPDHAGVVQWVAERGLEAEAHFIFLHPWLRSAQVLALLQWIAAAFPALVARDPRRARRWLVQLLCSALSVDAVTPPDAALRAELARAAPDAGALTFAAAGLAILRDPSAAERLAAALLTRPRWPEAFARAGAAVLAFGEARGRVDVAATRDAAGRLLAALEA